MLFSIFAKFIRLFFRTTHLCPHTGTHHTDTSQHACPLYDLWSAQHRRFPTSDIREKKKCYSRGYAIARCQAKTTLQSYGHELRDHQEYSKKIAMKTGTHTQVPLCPNDYFVYLTCKEFAQGDIPRVASLRNPRVTSKKRKPRGLPFLYSYLWGTDQ